MSQHPSLKISRVGKKVRTVLKRYERFFTLKKKGVLKDGSSVYGMPKLKIARVKVKKEKAAEKPEDVKAAIPSEGGAVSKKESTPATKKEEKKK